VYEEQFGISNVSALDHATPVGANAPGGESNRSVPYAPSLALSSQEPPVEIDNEVIPLVDAEREKHPVPTADELGEDDRLGPLPDVYRMAEDLCQNYANFVASIPGRD
jgi:hypothetical protein